MVCHSDYRSSHEDFLTLPFRRNSLAFLIHIRESIRTRLYNQQEHTPQLCSLTNDLSLPYNPYRPVICGKVCITQNKFGVVYGLRPSGYRYVEALGILVICPLL